MNTVDYILVVLMAISGLVGVLRGFIREALSVLVWILALWGAARYGGQLGPLLGGVLEDPVLQLWAGRTLAFVGILFAGSLLGWLAGYLIRNSAVTGTDRVLGLLFGLARGVIAIVLVILVLEEAGFCLRILVATVQADTVCRRCRCRVLGLAVSRSRVWANRQESGSSVWHRRHRQSSAGQSGAV
jgi:membrane protein required for colicin V production